MHPHHYVYGKVFVRFERVLYEECKEKPLKSNSCVFLKQKLYLSMHILLEKNWHFAVSFKECLIIYREFLKNRYFPDIAKISFCLDGEYREKESDVFEIGLGEGWRNHGKCERPNELKMVEEIHGVMQQFNHAVELKYREKSRLQSKNVDIHWCNNWTREWTWSLRERNTYSGTERTRWMVRESEPEVLPFFALLALYRGAGVLLPRARHGVPYAYLVACLQNCIYMQKDIFLTLNGYHRLCKTMRSCCREIVRVTDSTAWHLPYRVHYHMVSQWVTMTWAILCWFKWNLRP